MLLKYKNTLILLKKINKIKIKLRILISKNYEIMIGIIACDFQKEINL